MHALPLNEWESFYVIVGSSAAALTGLMFVVVALRTEHRIPGASEASAAFSTPTVVHFCGVLLISALLSTPGHSARSLSHCMLAAGVVGAVYSFTVIRKARRQHAYQMVGEDWLFHVFLPVLAYLVLVAAAILLRFEPGPALYLIAAVCMLLLFIGIHNAWDSAVYIADRKS